MDDGSSKKIAGSIFVIVLLLVGVLVGTLITRNLNTSQNTKTSASQSSVAPIEVINPAPGQTLSKSTEVKAMLSTPVEVTSLLAVYKVGEQTSIPMTITRQNEKVILNGTLEPSQLPKGRNTLSIFLYQTNSEGSELIGSSVFYIQI